MGEAYDAVPDTLKKLPNWVQWRLEDRAGKTTKIPYSLNGRMASSTDKSTWHSFKDIQHCTPTKQTGAGFCFNGDGIIGIDIDNCFDKKTGDVDTLFASIVDTLKDTYIEKSPSGNGLHIFVKCKDAPYETGKRKALADGKGLEIYSSGRYFTVTGIKWGESGSILEVPAQLIRDLCDPILSPSVKRIDNKTAAVAGNGMSDSEIISIATRAKNGIAVRALLDGSNYGYRSASEADMALSSMISFYTKDPAQLERIMRGSGLYRTKWDENPKYLAGTITTAIYNCRGQYKKSSSKKKEVVASIPEPAVTEVKMAERFVTSLGGNYVFNITTKNWHVWNGICWAVDERNSISNAAREFVKTLFKSKDDLTIDEVLENQKELIKLNTKAGIGNIISLASMQLVSIAEDFDADTHLLNLRNGTIVFDGKGYHFKDHDKSDMISLVSNCDYDPNASIPELWLNHIKTITGGDVELGNNIQEILGYCLDGGNPNEHFLMLHGGGRNGKSVTLRVFMNILGSYGLYVNPLTLMENGNALYSPERLLMATKRMIVAQEPNKPMEDISHRKDTTSVDSSFIKAASGGDVIPARKIHSNDIKNIRVSGVIVFCTNPLPRVTDDSVAFWERILTIPFKYVIPGWQRDPTVEAKLKGVSSGILNWLLMGYLRKKGSRFSLCDAIKDDISDYRNTVDEYAGFCHDCIEDSFDGTVKPQELYQKYSEFCSKTGLALNTEVVFLKKMGQKYNKKHTMNGNIFTQIKIRGIQTTVV